MFKPMLSGKVLPDLSNVRFPVLASLKLDGWRCTIQNGIALSRTLIPIPNVYVQQCLKGLPDGLDGEIIVGKPNDPNVFKTTDSALKSFSGMPDFKFYVFDCNEHGHSFGNRIALAKLYAEKYKHTIWLEHWFIEDKETLLKFEEWAVTNGYEGIMVRDPNGPYKHGRCTDKQGWLLKMKRFHDSEATVIGFKELEHNENEQTISALGYSKRSKEKAGMIAANTLGAFICRLDNGIEFDCGSGLTDAERSTIWHNKPAHLGKRIKFKYQNWTAERKPRSPIFLGMRSD